MRASKHSRARQAMTLVEILIAIGILAVGMMCICSLLPLGIRNTAVSVDRTVAASVAKTAIESLKHYSFDLTVAQTPLTDPPGVTYGFVGGQSLRDAGGLVTAIYNYHVAGCGGGAWPNGRPLGIWAPCPFSIPSDVELPLALVGGATANPAEYVRFPDNPEYGWTATLIPTTLTDTNSDGNSDDDPPPVDGRSDEDPPDGGDNDGDGRIDEDPPDITLNTSYYAQIAVWRVTGSSLDIKAFESGQTVIIKNNHQLVIVKNNSDGEQFLKAVKPGDYLACGESMGTPARDYYRLWYQVADVQAEKKELKLTRKVFTPCLQVDEEISGAGRPLWVASRYKLVAIYNTVITP